MKLPRRQLLHFVASAVAVTAVSRTARAQGYPNKPVHIIVPVPAGGPIDLAARLLGQWLAERLGQPFVVENRPSAGSHVGIEAVESGTGHRLDHVVEPYGLSLVPRSSAVKRDPV